MTTGDEIFHEIFQQVLDETIGGVPPHDQVRFVLHSNQLEYPIMTTDYDYWRLWMFLRIHQWREENERLGLEPTISDFCTAEQRETYLRDWLDDSDVMEAIRGEKRTHDEMMDEGPSTSHSVNEEVLQTGRGEVEDENERPFYIESVRQVNTKKFKTKAMNYRVQFTNALANAEISSLHGRLHEIFQQVLDETIGGVPPHDQVRFVLHSNQLEYPINIPFMAPNRLTTKRILAEFERVIQSNKEFRLNDTVEIVIHVSMPMGGRGTKRSEVNLEKHLDKKKSIIKIRNENYAWRELSWLLKPSSKTILATAKYESPIDRCKHDWHGNFTKMPTYLHTYIHTYIKFYLNTLAPTTRMLVSMGGVRTELQIHTYTYIQVIEK